MVECSGVAIGITIGGISSNLSRSPEVIVAAGISLLGPGCLVCAVAATASNKVAANVVGVSLPGSPLSEMEESLTWNNIYFTNERIS